MSGKKRCNFSGAFAAQDLGHGTWRLSQAQPLEVDVFLRGVDAQAGDLLARAPCADLGIEWRDRGALVTLSSAGNAARFAASSAIVHEPLNHLYATLPLARFDAKAERFWRRVFRLVRIPGGRHLLKFLAHASRKRS